MPAPRVQPAQPICNVVDNTTYHIPNSYSIATFVNKGQAVGYIKFGALGTHPQIIPLDPCESLTMPYVGRTYRDTLIDATGTKIKVIWVY